MTTAVSKGFLSRAELGLAPPKSISRNINPQEGGSTVHYAGGDQEVSTLLRGHTRCINLWRAYQKYHMGSRNFADIAYNGGFCQHGYVFAGRGVHIRSGANGTAFGNYRFYAWCWIGGEGETPTKEALQALAWIIRDARRQGGAGRRVVPHSFHKSTGCPGPLTDDAYALDNQDISGDRPMAVKDYEQVVIGANSKDLFAGIFVAKSYGWALCLATSEGKIEGVWPDPGVDARAGWGLCVGSARKLVRPEHMRNGGDIVYGNTWIETADLLIKYMEEHPPGTESRTGDPWAA